MEYIIRNAVERDIPAITDTYNQAIMDRSATLETEPTTQEERKEWLLQRDTDYVVLVLEEEGEVAGWASFNAFSEKCSYSGVVDFSIYIRREKRGIGIGRKLLSSLIECAKEQGFHKIVLSALNHNLVGKKLYTSLGFREVGVYEKHAVLEDSWVDIVLMEKILSEELPCGCGCAK